MSSLICLDVCQCLYVSCLICRDVCQCLCHSVSYLPALGCLGVSHPICDCLGLCLSGVSRFYCSTSDFLTRHVVISNLASKHNAASHCRIFFVLLCSCLVVCLITSAPVCLSGCLSVLPVDFQPASVSDSCVCESRAWCLVCLSGGFLTWSQKSVVVCLRLPVCLVDVRQLARGHRGCCV